MQTLYYIGAGFGLLLVWFVVEVVSSFRWHKMHPTESKKMALAHERQDELDDR